MTITELREVAENIESRYTEAEKRVSRIVFSRYQPVLQAPADNLPKRPILSAVSPGNPPRTK